MKFDPKAVYASQDFLILDTETTGLGNLAEICQIAIIDSSGTPLLNTLVRPIHGIPAVATAIHGISNEDVSKAPRWWDIADTIKSIIAGRDLFIYNAAYDLRLIDQSHAIAGLGEYEINWVWAFCVMKEFAEVYGDWNDYHGSYTWKPLSFAASYYKVTVENAHTALGDCLMTLGVMRGMWGNHE